MKKLLMLFGLLFAVLSKVVLAVEIYSGDIKYFGMIVPIGIDGKLYRFLVASGMPIHVINEALAETKVTLELSD